MSKLLHISGLLVLWKQNSKPLDTALGLGGEPWLGGEEDTFEA